MGEKSGEFAKAINGGNLSSVIRLKAPLYGPLEVFVFEHISQTPEKGKWLFCTLFSCGLPRHFGTVALCWSRPAKIVAPKRHLCQAAGAGTGAPHFPSRFRPGRVFASNSPPVSVTANEIQASAKLPLSPSSSPIIAI